MKHLLKLSDLTAEEITEILNLGDQLKYEKKHGIAHPRLAGQTLGMIFQKSSTRTRVSFEAGMYQLGGSALFLSANDLQLGRGEPIKDTARVLSRYLDGIMIRTYKQSDVEDLAAYGTIPIVNGLTDYAHPCQVLADLMTIREYKQSLAGLKLCFVGDGNNMANSLIVGCIKMGMRVSIACPAAYRPDGSWRGRSRPAASPAWRAWKRPLRMRMWCIRTYGRPWAWKRRCRRAAPHSRAIRSTTRSCALPSRTQSCSTASRRTVARRSPTRLWNPMPGRS